MQLERGGHRFCGFSRIFWDVLFLGYIVIRMDVRISRISPIRTDFFGKNVEFSAKNRKKSVR
ncbi:MAG: hypothetical protein RLZZ628_2747, partial [Bacteroidota bacterium]